MPCGWPRGPLEPHWNIYKQHDNKNVLDILDEYYIGDLIVSNESINVKESVDEKIIDNKSLDNPYNNEPIRPNSINVLKKEPFNGQPDLKNLRKNYITPVENWYIRNHHPTPDINKDDYYLTISTPFKSYKLDFKKILDYPEVSIVNTIQCAGNRRKEFNDNCDKVMGLNWNGGAIGNSKFTGVYLRDIVKNHIDDIKNYINEDMNIFVQLIGNDLPFDGSVFMNIRELMSSDILLAYKMNDETLERDHGYPLRVIVPGYSGAKNIKWIKEIKISSEESTSTWQKGVAYKSFGPNIKSFKDISDEDKSKIPTVEKLPVQSIICDAKKITKDDKDFIKVEGIAYSGGGSNIIRVDVTLDKEKWYTANLQEGKDQTKYKAYAWTFWSIDIPVEKTESKEKIEIFCKATDVNYNTQPENCKDIWNLRGILNNSWHKFNCII